MRAKKSRQMGTAGQGSVPLGMGTGQTHPGGRVRLWVLTQKLFEICARFLSILKSRLAEPLSPANFQWKSYRSVTLISGIAYQFYP